MVLNSHKVTSRHCQIGNSNSAGAFAGCKDLNENLTWIHLRPDAVENLDLWPVDQDQRHLPVIGKEKLNKNSVGRNLDYFYYGYPESLTLELKPP
jgi:hypothetical protein